LSEQLPVIDLQALHEADGLSAVAAEFRAVYSTIGFGAIINHGIPRDLLDALFDASGRFHALPMRRKMQVALNDAHRGYIPINTSTDVNSKLAEVRKPNQSESFMIMREDLPDSTPVRSNAYLAGANQWPELPGFRETLTEANRQFASVAQKLLDVVCAALAVNPSQIKPAFGCPTTWLRLLHYPPQPPIDDLYGSAPHTDFGCLTLLAQDNVAGLQVQTTSGDWINVEPDRDALIVNVGDMLHRWSNGVLKSTPHRVVNLSGRERYSCAFFYDPYVDTVIEPLSECVGSGKTALFKPIHFGEFLRAELEASYRQHQKA
jgi:isopenicillin N synthase-like dioxygenase